MPGTVAATRSWGIRSSKLRTVAGEGLRSGVGFVSTDGSAKLPVGTSVAARTSTVRVRDRRADMITPNGRNRHEEVTWTHPYFERIYGLQSRNVPDRPNPDHGLGRFKTGRSPVLGAGMSACFPFFDASAVLSVAGLLMATVAPSVKGFLIRASAYC